MSNLSEDQFNRGEYKVLTHDGMKSKAVISKTFPSWEEAKHHAQTIDPFGKDSHLSPTIPDEVYDKHVARSRTWTHESAEYAHDNRYAVILRRLRKGEPKGGW